MVLASRLHAFVKCVVLLARLLQLVNCVRNFWNWCQGFTLKCQAFVHNWLSILIFWGSAIPPSWKKLQILDQFCGFHENSLLVSALLLVFSRAFLALYVQNYMEKWRKDPVKTKKMFKIPNSVTNDRVSSLLSCFCFGEWNLTDNIAF